MTIGTSFHALREHHGTIEDARWIVSHIWPAPPTDDAPPDVPPNIARNFVQAERNRRRDDREAAGMCYRRTLELTVQDKGVEERGTLKKRIDTLGKQLVFVPALLKWAHTIRLLGNDAAHEPDEPSKEEIESLGEFTKVFLEYVYTIPARIARHSPAAHTQEADISI